MKGKEKMLDKKRMNFKLEKVTIQQVSEKQMFRNESSKKKSLQERGITLIALVVTIIILLILAGVTLNMALSQDGLFSKTQEAADKYKKAQEDEELEIEKIEYVADGKDIKEMQKISSKEEFISFRDKVNQGENFDNTLIKLSSDLDLENKEWTPIGTVEHPFNGVFNGNGHKITNIKTNPEEEYQGLFGVNAGIIKNIGIESGEIKGMTYVGGIAAFSSGNIENCYNKTNISMNSAGSSTLGVGGVPRAGVGGIVGILGGDSDVYHCYNNGKIEATEKNNGAKFRCYCRWNMWWIF